MKLVMADIADTGSIN